MNITKNMAVALVLTFMLTSTTVFAFTITGAGLTLVETKIPNIAPPVYAPLATHQPYILDIQTNFSEVTYHRGLVKIGEPKNHSFKISGKFRLIVDPDSYSQTVLWLEPMALVVAPLPDEPFRFPTFPIAYDGLTFSGTGNWCNLTSCGQLGYPFFLGNEASVEGLFDGKRVEMRGAAQIGFLDSFSYTIRASVIESAPVPEPSTIVLFGSVAAGLYFIRYRKGSKSNCRELRKEHQ